MAGKQYTQARAAVDRERLYAPLEAVRLLKASRRPRSTRRSRCTSGWASTCATPTSSCAARCSCPTALGKTVTVAVFAQGEKAKEAEEAGADFVGGDDLAAKVTEGWTDFDVAIATPDMMGTVGRLGRILGPQGKMPNPKSGTITFDIGKAVTDVKAGKIEYRTDRTGIIHVAIGKKSFDERALVENYGAVLDEILRAKPAASKGRYLRSITLASTMGPGLHLDTTKVRDLLEEPAGS